MFEGKLASVLNDVLGAYAHGISTRDLRVAVFTGNIVLRDVRLRVEALNALGLPFRVQSGVVGKLALKIPWASLGKNPVVARVEDVYVVAGFAEPDEALSVEERTRRWEEAAAAAKRKLVDEGERRWLAAAKNKDASDADTKETEVNPEEKRGRYAGLIDTVLGNLEVTVERVHLRLEGDLRATSGLSDETPSSSASRASDPSSSDPSSSDPAADPDPFALGVTLASLALNTVDANGEPTFVGAGLAERMRKSATLERLAAYFDAGAASLRPDGVAWADVAPATLVDLMRVGVTADDAEEAAEEAAEEVGEASPSDRARARARAQARSRSLLLAPVGASLAYGGAAAGAAGLGRGGAEGAPSRGRHLHEARVEPPRAAFLAAERMERDARRAPHAHLRPAERILPEPRTRGADHPLDGPTTGGGDGSGARAWWAFAIAATRLELRRLGKVPSRLENVVDAMRARKAYVGAYARALRASEKKRGKRKKSTDDWAPPPLAVGAAPEMDAVEREYPVRACVLFRALAHAQVRKEADGPPKGSGKEDEAANGGEEANEGVARRRNGGGWFFGWLGRGKSGEGGSEEESDPNDAEMSEDDWAALRTTFDVDGHAAVAAEAAGAGGDESSDDEGLKAEASVRVGAMSFELADDENKSKTNPAETIVLSARARGVLAGARAIGRDRADVRAAVASFDVSVDGARMARAAGSGARDEADAKREAFSRREAFRSTVKGSAAADETARMLWRLEDDDEEDAPKTPRSSAAEPSESSTEAAAARVPVDALRLRFLKNPPARSETSSGGDETPPDYAVSAVIAPARCVAVRAPIARLVAVLARHKPARTAEQDELLRQAVEAGARAAANAARDPLALALADRPVVDVAIVVHAPKIAAPSDADAFLRDERAEASSRSRETLEGSSTRAAPYHTLLLDLGRFEMRSCSPVALGGAADADAAKRFDAFAIKVSDISRPSPRPRPRQTRARFSTSPTTPRGAATGEPPPPRRSFPRSPPTRRCCERSRRRPKNALEIAVRADALRVAASPARLRGLNAVLAQLAAGSAREETTRERHSFEDHRAGVSAASSSTPPAPPSSDDRAEVLVESFGRLQWTPCVVRAEGSTLACFDADDASARRTVPALAFAAGGGALRLPERFPGGAPHAVVACSSASAAKTAFAAIRDAETDGSRANLRAFAGAGSGRFVSPTAAASARWRVAINAAARRSPLAAAARDEPDDDLFGLEGDEGEASVDATGTRLAGDPSNASNASNPSNPSAALKLTATLSRVSFVVAAPLAYPDDSRGTISRGDSLASSRSSGDRFFDAEDADDAAGDANASPPWWVAPEGFEGGPREGALVRLALDGVAAVAETTDDGAKEVVLRLAALDVVDEYAVERRTRRRTMNNGPFGSSTNTRASRDAVLLAARPAADGDEDPSVATSVSPADDGASHLYTSDAADE